MSGINRLINGELAQSGTTGPAFVKEMAAALSPEAIAAKDPDCDEGN